MRCRSCGEPIGFIERPNDGKRMPVDPELIKTFLHPDPKAAGRKLRLVTERGVIVAGVECSVTVAGAISAEGYLPHWATCTQPDVHRKSLR